MSGGAALAVWLTIGLLAWFGLMFIIFQMLGAAVTA